MSNKLSTKADFFHQFNIKNEDYEKTGLNWSDLNHIFVDFKAKYEELEGVAIFLSNRILKTPKVHSIRYRIKNPSHLIEKIIRKKIEDPEREITINNYQKEITDLIGIRALHLYKEDWKFIDKEILKNWNLDESPIIYYRKGDDLNYFKEFENLPHDVREHKNGYRSIHYLLKTTPTKTEYIAELQVRTIFEEGWSEVNHSLIYPYYTDNEIINHYLRIFNRLTGSADEMASFIKILSYKFESFKTDLSTALKESEEKSDTISDLKKTINALKIDAAIKTDINKEIDAITKLKIKIPILPGMISYEKEFGSTDWEKIKKLFIKDLDEDIKKLE